MSDAPEPVTELDDETLAFAHRMFDLARQGDPDLLGLIDAGLPVDLTDPKGNTGADPSAGTPYAIETSWFFEGEDLVARLERGRIRPV